LSQPRQLRNRSNKNNQETRFMIGKRNKPLLALPLAFRLPGYPASPPD
jgi:hypothetical protein